MLFKFACWLCRDNLIVRVQRDRGCDDVQGSVIANDPSATHAPPSKGIVRDHLDRRPAMLENTPSCRISV
jgi:hypothetical protein